MMAIRKRSTHSWLFPAGILVCSCQSLPRGLAAHPCRDVAAPAGVACGGVLPDTPFSDPKITIDVFPAGDIISSFGEASTIDKVWAGAPSGDLAARLVALARMDFSLEPYGVKDCWASSLGDLVREFCRVRSAPGGTLELWSLLAKKYPRLHNDVYPILSELLQDTAFQPGGSVDRQDDGFYFSSFTLGGRTYAQGATLFFACAGLSDACDAIKRIKSVERRLTLYPYWTGLVDPYDWVRIVGNRVAQDPERRLALTVWEYNTRHIVSGIFFGGDYGPQFQVTMLEAFVGGYLTSVYCFLSGGYFDYLWGFDLYLPVFASDGTFTCMIVVTTLSCSPGNPIQFIRENLGNFRWYANNGL
jgi:hypothetical protein